MTFLEFRRIAIAAEREVRDVGSIRAHCHGFKPKCDESSEWSVNKRRFLTYDRDRPLSLGFGWHLPDVGRALFHRVSLSRSVRCGSGDVGSRRLLPTAYYPRFDGALALDGDAMVGRGSRSSSSWGCRCHLYTRSFANPACQRLEGIGGFGTIDSGCGALVSSCSNVPCPGRTPDTHRP